MAAIVMLAACGGGGDSESAWSPASDSRPETRLERLSAADARVGEVFFRLAVANLDLCDTVAPAPGWTLHAARQYGAALRPLAEARFGLDGDLPGVLSVAPGGPADRAGLAAGDLILAVDGRVLARGGDGEAAAFEGLERNLDVLRRAMADGPVELSLRRGGGEARTVRLAPVAACAFDVHVEPGEDRNARANGRAVFISAGLAHFAASDDDLALVLGHELAHNILRHRDASGRLTRAGRAGDAERRADAVGLCLAMRAGYGIDGAPGFWRRLGAADWRARYPQLGHPSAESRARSLEAAAAEIEARRRLGLPPAPCVDTTDASSSRLTANLESTPRPARAHALSASTAS